jgi:UDP-N-acetylmuramoyl-L-alanyl-D-glutamate--2,6-diaminopimelate ligase
MLQNCSGKKYYYSIGKMADFRGRVREMHFEGMHIEINDKDLWIRLTGRFNVLNVLAVYGTSMLLGHNEEQVMEALSIAESAEGRFDVLRGKDGTAAVVDYAHTDDALRNVLETIHDMNRDRKKVITVVGAGGDRDRTKRPLMGAIAAMMSSKVILTSDNPRTESASDIMKEMEAGIPNERLMDVLKIADREEAIKTACMLAEGGIVLVAGKGHEKYQVIGNEKLPFDDKEVVTKYLK